MKLKMILLLITGVSVFVAGCSNEEKTINTAEETMMETSDSFDNIDDSVIDDGEIGNVYHPETAEILDNSRDGISDTVTLYPTQLFEFSEGVAWVEGNREDTGDNIYALVNENGEALYVEEENVVYVSECKDGLSFIRTLDQNGNVVSKVIDKDGSLIFTSKETDNAVVLGYGDGVFIVGKQVQGFDINETQIGVVDKNGQWISNLGTDKFVVNETCYINNIDKGKENTLQYLGEGVFMAYEEDNWLHKVFYNVAEDVNFELNGYWYLMGNYYNGKLLMYNSNDYGYVGVNYMDKIGNITMITGEVNTNKIGQYSNGLWYYDGGFYNDEGTKIVDIEQYKEQIESVKHRYPVFVDGYSVIALMGKDSKSYYTVIDMNGEFMFEPRVLEFAYYKENSGLIVSSDKTSPGIMKDGLFSIYENGKWVYYNVYGEKEIEVNIDVGASEVQITPYDNNIALIHSDSINYYIGRDGEVTLQTMVIDEKLLK